MLATERELIALVYALYGIDCTHWLKQGEVAFTRRLSGGWKRSEWNENSFSLLGRMPVISNPLDLRPGLIISENKTRPISKDINNSLQTFQRKFLPRQDLFTALSITAALNLLVFVPALLVLGVFESFWIIPCSVMLVMHLSLITQFYSKSKLWRASCSSKFWQEFIALTLNPVAALRCGDVLSRRLFDVEGGN